MDQLCVVMVSQYANLAKAFCLAVHESVHVPHVDCSHGGDGYSPPRSNAEKIPPFPPQPSGLTPGTPDSLVDRSECAAYTASIACMEIAKHGCFGDKDSEQQIQDDIDWQSKNWQHFCYPELRPGGLDNRFVA